MIKKANQNATLNNEQIKEKKNAKLSNDKIKNALNGTNPITTGWSSTVRKC
jgi:hypothetical protein